MENNGVWRWPAFLAGMTIAGVLGLATLGVRYALNKKAEPKQEVQS